MLKLFELRDLAFESTNEDGNAVEAAFGSTDRSVCATLGGRIAAVLGKGPRSGKRSRVQGLGERGGRDR